MANNRMYLRCRNCGEVFFLGKCLGDGYWLNRYDGQSADLRHDLNKFYDIHSAWGCSPASEEKKAESLKDWDVPLLGDYIHENQFEIVYENLIKLEYTDNAEVV